MIEAKLCLPGRETGVQALLIRSSPALAPALENFLGRCDLDLLAEARPEMPQHGVVGFVGDAAQRVLGDDHAIAGVDRIHDGGQDAHISLAARDDQGVGLKPPERPQESRFLER